MQKIKFINNSEPFLSAENLNLLQDNIETAIIDSENTLKEEISNSESTLQEEIECLYGNQIKGTATGTNINVQDSSNLKMVSLVVDGKSTQDGTPTPDFPSEIEVIEDNIAVNVVGKNLFDYTKIENAKNWEAWPNAKLLEYHLKPNTKYTLSTNAPLGTTVLIYFNGDTTDKNGVSLDNAKTMISDENGYLFVAIFTDRDYYNDVINGEYYVQLEEGSIATEYVPYQENTIELILPEGEFAGKIDDTYKDKFRISYNKEEHKYHLYLDKMIGKSTILLNGDTYTNGSLIFYWFPKDAKDMFANTWHGCTLSEVGKHIQQSNEEPIYVSGAGSRWNYGIVYNTDLISTLPTVDELKGLVDGKTYYYVLAEPYEIDLGEVTMPKTYKNVSNIMNSKETNMNVEYYKDLETVINNLTSAVVALGATE